MTTSLGLAGRLRPLVPGLPIVGRWRLRPAVLLATMFGRQRQAAPDSATTSTPGWRRWRPPASLPLATAAVAGLALALLVVDMVPDGATPEKPAASVVIPEPPTSPVAPLLDPLVSTPEPAAGPEVAEPPAGRRSLPEIPDVPAELDDIARELQRRRAEVLELEATLALREAAVRAAEADLAAQVDRLEAFKGELEALVGEAEAEEEERLQQLVRMYESMRAKSAAAIFDRLELPVILAVARRMREARMAAILAAMDPARARVVTSELASERELPRLD
jgi:flagellar motility protein MotE (MotC chaperone)